MVYLPPVSPPHAPARSLPPPLRTDLSHAIFVHRKLVEGVNSVVHGKGTRKVDILTAIKDFKKGIYQLEWEHRRCDMMIDDLKEKTRELQLLHVTRDIQVHMCGWVVGGGGM